MPVLFKNIPFDDVTIRRPISVETLLEVETSLGFRFPDDYREFITTFGDGDIMDGAIRAFSPRHILAVGLGETRDRLSEFWFWDQSPDILNQEKAVQCVPFFDSADGDDILFHPNNPDEWFVLAHEADTVITVHSFQSLFNFYLQRYNEAEEEIKPPFKFRSWCKD
jgi:SMI1 / KNR4 family (SUKH-1)